MTIPTTAPWQDLAAQKRQTLETYLGPWGLDAVPKTKDKNVLPLSTTSLTDEQIQITSLGPGELLSAIKSKQLSSVDVTEAFCRRASVAHGLVNCVNEAFYERALKRAQELDDHLATTGQTVGPLHGLPISLKNQCNVEGIEMNMDYIGWIGRISPESGAMADILHRQGAVLYVLTNMSQALFSSDSWNNLYGRTVNPRNTSLAAGGSSGGEGALIAMKGSPLGVGSDLGGSVRVPAAYNGLYGFRGSWHRMPYGGSTNSQLGQESVPSVLGPLSATIDGLKLFYQSVLEAEPWLVDPMCPRMPWNQAMYESKTGPLCFALQWHNGHVMPNPPYIRAMQRVKDALLAQGHTVVDWQFPDTAKDLDLLVGVYLADGGVDVQTECDLVGEPVLGGILKSAKKKSMSVVEYHKHTYQARLSTGRLLKAWAQTASITSTGRPIDAVITPAAPYPSFVPGEEEYIMYTGVCNLHDLPTAVVPILEVDSSVDAKAPAHGFMSAADEDIYQRYDPERYHGMPIGLQVIGQRGEDEAVIRMAEIMDEAVKAAL